MVNKLFVTLFEHVKNVESVSNVSISSQSFMVAVSDDDEDVNRIVRLGHILGLTVVCSPSNCKNHLIVSFYL